MSALPKEDSRAIPLRYGVLKWMARSPAHAIHALYNPVPDTPYMRLGRLAHAIALGQPIGPVWTGDRRGKAWLEFKEAHCNEDIVTDSECETASAMAAALAAHDEAAELLSGERELPVLFTIGDRECITHPDVYARGQHLTELKTTQDASPERFPWHAIRMGYHGQVMWQAAGLAAAGLPVPDRKAIVAVETRPPFAVCCFVLTPRAEDFGTRTWRLWFERFINCEKSGAWPGYPAGLIDAPEEGAELIGADGEILEVD